MLSHYMGPTVVVGMVMQANIAGPYKLQAILYRIITLCNSAG